MATEDCRRKFVRFPTNALVWWSRDWEAEPIALMDISAGGMLCEFPCELKLGLRICLHFEFPQDENMIFCHATVVHCRKDGPAYMVGLEITELEGMNQADFVKRVKKGIEVKQAEA